MDFDFDDFMKFIVSPSAKQSCCSNEDIRIIDNTHMTCVNCGKVNEEIFTTDKYEEHHHYKQSQPYKRCIYFKQKMNMICCNIAYPLNPKIIHFIKCNKGKKFKSINRLKKLMTSAKLNKYYKYIYSIYQDITGDQLVTLTQAEINLYCNQFIKIEKYFLLNNMRKNLYSYNVILCMLMKYNNNDAHKKIILPFNKVKIKKIVTSINDKLI
jgi:hypothetical protein